MPQLKEEDCEVVDKEQGVNERESKLDNVLVCNLCSVFQKVDAIEQPEAGREKRNSNMGVEPDVNTEETKYKNDDNDGNDDQRFTDDDNCYDGDDDNEANDNVAMIAVGCHMMASGMHGVVL